MRQYVDKNDLTNHGIIYCMYKDPTHYSGITSSIISWIIILYVSLGGYNPNICLTIDTMV